MRLKKLKITTKEVNMQSKEEQKHICILGYNVLQVVRSRISSIEDGISKVDIGFEEIA